LPEQQIAPRTVRRCWQPFTGLVHPPEVSPASAAVRVAVLAVPGPLTVTAGRAARAVGLEVTTIRIKNVAHAVGTVGVVKTGEHPTVARAVEARFPAVAVTAAVAIIAGPAIVCRVFRASPAFPAKLRHTGARDLAGG
jgi:hypothetical protein